MMSTNGNAPAKVVPVRHFGRWVATAVVLLLLVMLVHSLFSKIPAPVRGREWRFSWNIVGQYFFNPLILHGLVLTLELTPLAMIIGIGLGVIIAVMRLSSTRLLSTTAWGYTWFFRGTPVLVQLLFWFNIAAVFPRLTLGIPFGPSFYTINVNAILTVFIAAMIGLGLNEGAYMSEIVRSGIQAIDEGQTEAATSLGMTRAQTLRLVVLPQAMRVIIPPTGNEVIGMLKTTSLASVIGLFELLGSAEDIYARNYETLGLLITAALWYLVWTTVLSCGQFYVERYYSRGSLRVMPLTPVQRLVRDLRGIAGKFQPHQRLVRTGHNE